MGFWSRLLGKEEKSDTWRLFRELYGAGRESSTGIAVTLDRTLEDDTAWACMRVITEGNSQVPWRLYREVDGRTTIASDHRLDDILHRRPNGWQTSFEYRETMSMHLLLAGNHYSFINRVGSKREVKELIPIEPRYVTVKQKPDYSLVYNVTNDAGERREFGSDAIWHLRGPSWNSWMGLDAIKQARNAIGLSASIEQGQAEFQKNGGRAGGLYSVEDKLNEDQFKQLDDWLKMHAIGGERSHMPLIMDRGAKFSSNTMSGVDQQLLETRRHQVEAVCRRFRVMPLMVGHPADMAARAATESIFIQHVVHTLMPWHQRIDQSADVNLLSEAERGEGYYTKLNSAGLMRGNTKDQAEYFARALGSGGSKPWMTQNEIRRSLDLDRADDPEADKLTPLNAGSGPARSAAEGGQTQEDDDDDQ